MTLTVVLARSQRKNDPNEIEYEAVQDTSAETAPSNTIEEQILNAINRMSERHRRERESFDKQSRARTEALKSELASYYKLEARQQAIHALQEKLNAPSLIPRFARRFFGIDKETQSTLEALHADQKSAALRIKTTIAKINSRENRDLHALKKRHAREIQTLNRRLENLHEHAQLDRSGTKKEISALERHVDMPELTR